MSNAGQVGNDSLDAVSLSFNLGDDPLHLVAVKGIADITTNVDERHVDDCLSAGFESSCVG